MTLPGTEFERRVGDFCRRNWGTENVKMNTSVDGREVDCIVEVGNEIIIIECTTERNRKKAEHDISKIRSTRRALVGDLRTKTVSGFFITQGDPTPEIHQVAKDNGAWIKACSIASFINEFNCSSRYIFERQKRPFGSVRNPQDDSIHLDRSLYVQVPFRNYDERSEITVDQIIDDINQRRKTRFVATGDFGVGKSMTYREMFFRFADLFERGESYRFPIYINLNETAFDEGDDFVDLLERHAKWVGLRSEREKLVHAWTSDCCILILDGFDELIRAGFTRLTTSSKDIRFASSHIIRSAVSESPKNTPILISGRQSYFSNFQEMKAALGAQGFSHISLQDLHEQEVKSLYRKINPKGADPVIMEWLPQRPLLLSYIYFELGPSISGDHELLTPLSPGNGWNILLERLCTRETNVARGAEPRQIRRLLERIALYARTNIADPGRITSLHVANAYRDVMQMEPDLSVQQVLMRFPGLTTGHANEERSFIDETIYEAAQAGTVVEAIDALASKSNDYLRSEDITRLLDPLKRTRTTISQLTAQIATSTLKRQDYGGRLSVALEEAISNNIYAHGNIPADILLCCSLDPEIFLRPDLKKITISGAHILEIDITNGLLNGRIVKFVDCIFDILELSIDKKFLRNLNFECCRVGTLSCSGEASDSLEAAGLRNADVEKRVIFDGTNADILDMSIPDNFKVIKIVLRKLFRQAGSGRKKSAFYRGMHGIDGDLIERCLTELHRRGIVYVVGVPQSDDSVWHPNRAHTKRADFLIDSVSTPDDVLLRDVT